MKKTALILLAVALLAAACGDDEAAETTTTAAPATTQAPAPEPAPAAADVLDNVIARGELNCGVNETIPGFGYKDAAGTFTGFDVDLCRAVAAAILGDSEAVRFEALTAAARFEALTSGLIDLLVRNTTWTQSRDTDLGLDFGPTTYYDGQQLMAKGEQGFSSGSALEEIEGATVCAIAGTTTEKNMTEAANAAGVSINLSTFEDFNVVIEGFKSGACDVVTSDGSTLVSRKATEGDAGADWVIFPSVPISKEPLGPSWIQNQSRMGDVVNWTVFAMLIAEEKGITSSNVDDMMSVDGEASRLLGATEDELQTKMGLPRDAFYQVIKQVGNYAEVYDRHLTPLGLERGLNALQADGGLLYPPPAR
ncbi:MAG: amino acid ABC transporter substrate-binding protein [Acidimicrobiia bacterium]|nr:amino acid ABC transporter substrate-binding protein [Acidimicrobiia bacterium]MYB78551.1 amino acid ABC transporter substrate-binding protein [Acidimicrobiia bacterium]